MEQKEVKKQGDMLVKSLEDVFKQAPHLPVNIRETLVNISPILALIFGILGIIAGLGLIGVSPIALLGGVNASINVLVSGIIAIIASALLLMAYPKLTKRQYSGWMLLFWSELANVISALLSISFGSIIGIVIGLYILFEIKSYYK